VVVDERARRFGLPASGLVRSRCMRARRVEIRVKKWNCRRVGVAESEKVKVEKEQ